MRTTPQNMFLAVLLAVLLVAHSTGAEPLAWELRSVLFLGLFGWSATGQSVSTAFQLNLTSAKTSFYYRR